MNTEVSYIYIYLMNSSVFEKHCVFYSSSHQVVEKRRCNFKSCTTKSWYFLCCYSSGWLWLIDCYFDWMAQRRRAGGTNPKARCRSHSLSLDAEVIDRSWRRTPRTLISVAKGSGRMRPNGFGLIDVRRAQGYGACTALSPERGEILKILSPHSPCLFITGDTMTSLSGSGTRTQRSTWAERRRGRVGKLNEENKQRRMSFKLKTTPVKLKISFNDKESSLFGFRVFDKSRGCKVHAWMPFVCLFPQATVGVCVAAYQQGIFPVHFGWKGKEKEHFMIGKQAGAKSKGGGGTVGSRRTKVTQNLCSSNKSSCQPNRRLSSLQLDQPPVSSRGKELKKSQ